MHHKQLLVANWKMNLLPSAEVLFITRHSTVLAEHAKRANRHLVICPSFLSLATMANHLRATKQVSIGAQDCSEHTVGAYTGEIAAVSLSEICCTHAIVGHSENRAAHGTTNDAVAHKAVQLLTHSITPIICVGEHTQSNSIAEIDHQLNPLLKIITPERHQGRPVYIAYEPVSAIGTGVIPHPDHLKKIVAHIKTKLASLNPRILYGGSVTPHELIPLEKYLSIDGYLVGKASLDFQELQNMLTSLQVV